MLTDSGWRRALAVVVLAVALAGGATEAALAAAPELEIYSEIDCFNLPNVKKRLCAQWRLTAATGGGFDWHLVVSDIGIQSELYNKTESFSAKDKATLLAALKKGQQWSATAQKNHVDFLKRIANIGGKLAVDFLATDGGRQCAVRFSMKGWLEKSPVFMFAPYAPQEQTANSIGGMIAALVASDRAYKQKLSEARRTQKLFR